MHLLDECRVLSHLEIRELGEGLLAAGMATPVRPIPSVNPGARTGAELTPVTVMLTGIVAGGTEADA